MSLKRPPPAPSWAGGLATVGVTGTNGKTTTTTLLAAALGRLARPVACITTLGRYLDGERLTGLPPRHAGFLALMRRAIDEGGRYASIEVTSEALAMGFSQAWPCRVGVFTNLTRDHLDAHGSAEHYLASKAQLFVALPQGGTAVLAASDPAGELLAEIVPKGVRQLRWAAASRGPAWAPPHLEVTSAELDWSGTIAQLRWSTEDWPEAAAAGPLPETVRTRAIGDVFAENAAAALLGAIAMGVPAMAAAEAIAEAPAPPGRFQVVAERPHVVVDFAHTPDALERTVAAARRLTKGRVALVFGAGGNRDREKRPPMGEAAREADRIWLTSDNPRDESPRAIAEAIRRGLGGHSHVQIELDRARAIGRAIADADEGDVVVIAGKGHEGEQIGRGGSTRPFSDVEVARAARARRPGG